MKISLQYLDQLQGITDWNLAKGFLRQQFEDLASQISAGWNQEHNADGSHASVTLSGNVSSPNGIGTFAGQPRCILMPGGDTTLTSGVGSTLSWVKPAGPYNTGFYENGWEIGGQFLDPADPTHLTAPMDGIYLVSYFVRFEGINTTGYRFSEMSITGGIASSALGTMIQDGMANGNTMAFSIVLNMLLGQHVRIDVAQTSGGNLKVLGATTLDQDRTWISMTKIA